MRITRIGYALGVAAAVAMFAGCSSNSSSLGPIVQAPGSGTQSIVSVHPWIAAPQAVLRGLVQSNTPRVGGSWGATPDVASTLIYGCMFYNTGGCNWYVKGHNVVSGNIAASHVNDICVDKTNHVWIPDGGAQTITEYAKGSTTPMITLTDASQPSACAVDSNGTVYVANIVGPSGVRGDVDVFPAGHTTATRHVTVAQLAGGSSTGPGLVVGVAVDENHLLAVNWLNETTGASGINEYTNARGTGTMIESFGGDFPGSVVFDNAENIVAIDQNAFALNTYNGSTHALCHSTTLPGSAGNDDWIQGSLSKTNGDIVIGDTGNLTAGTGQKVTDFSFANCAAGGVVRKNYTAGLISANIVIGAAIDPGSTN